MKLDQGKKFSNGERFGAEIYSGADGGRYLTITGNQAGGDAVPTLTREQFEIPYFLVRQFHNTKLRKLWMGDRSAYLNDTSRADLALCNELVRLLGPDKALIDRYFRASKLMREKWERDDYRNWTLDKALAVKKKEDAPPAPSENPVPSMVDAEPVLIEGDTIVMKRLVWMWKDRIPIGKLTLFAGNPDNGKSLVSTWLAATVITGRHYPDVSNATPPSEVLMMLGEDDLADTAVPRLTAAGANVGKVHFLEAVQLSTGEKLSVRLDAHLAAIEKVLTRHPAIRLIVIDPISNYLGKVSMVGEQEVRQVLVPLKDLAEKHNVAVVIIMHFNKKADLDAIARVGGAMAFVGVSRASWVFIRDEVPEDESQSAKPTYSMLQLKNNLAPISKNGLSYSVAVKKLDELQDPTMEAAWTPFIVWGGAAKVHDADTALGSKRNDRGRPKNAGNSKTDEAVQFLLNALQAGPLSKATVVADAGRNNISAAVLELAANAEHLDVEGFWKSRVRMWKLRPVIAPAQSGDLIEVESHF